MFVIIDIFIVQLVFVIIDIFIVQLVFVLDKEFYAQYFMENPNLLNLNVIFKQAGNVVRMTSFSDSKYGDAITNTDVPTSFPVTVTAVAKGVNTPVLINGHPEVTLQFHPTVTTNPLSLKFELANTSKYILYKQLKTVTYT